MSVVVSINSTDRSSLVVWSSLEVVQNLTSLVDTARFTIKKYGSRIFEPAVNDDVVITDNGTKVFGGKILRVNRIIINAAEGLVYECECVDHTYAFDSELVSKAYENQTITQIIADIASSFTDGSFTTNNVTSSFTIDKIVFNQVYPSACLKRLADIVQYHWYIDPDKDIHFFPKLTESAPFDLTDSSNNYIQDSLRHDTAAEQVANLVKVRGGEYNGTTYTDIITVKGNDSKSFDLPYKFANLTIELDTGAGFVSQDVGVDFINDFTTDDVLYNYNERTIRFENALADGDRIRFSGNPKRRVLAAADDAASIATYGTKEKIIRDNTIEDLNTARQRAIAELYAYREPISDVKYSTRETGLNVGQAQNVNSTKRSLNEDFIIKKLRIRMRNKDDAIYDVDLVTTKTFGLLELLQKLLEPDPDQIDNAEEAEIIKTVNEDIDFAEVITNVTPKQVFETVDLDEDIQKDPLGADTPPDFVLAPYVPDPWPTDTKRVGLLDNSLQVY